MTRVFAKLVGFKKGWGMNILVFDTVSREVEQILTDGNGQTGQFTDLSYEEGTHRLIFVVCGHMEKMTMFEISDATLKVIQRPDNWKSLCHGLKIKSPKTLAWCEQRGIYGRCTKQN